MSEPEARLQEASLDCIIEVASLVEFHRIEGKLREAGFKNDPNIPPTTNGINVNIISPVYFFATKTEAFKNRGNNDYRFSHDFEDIVTLVNGRSELVHEMKTADPKVRNAMREFWLPMLENANLVGAIQEHIDAFEKILRTEVVLDRFQEMLRP